ncbi:secretory carrier-associated membrane protein 3 isoform X2 [Amia ocellicauda]|uniref:secretory carrier-associated membrane protein 3 isoform X2 n=1 Tax=Amia ocellicauda TaxID=2972642 RepID=UPI003463AEB9
MSQYTHFPEPGDDSNPFTHPPPYQPAPSPTVQPAPAPAQPPHKKSSPTEPRNYGSYNKQPGEVTGMARADLQKQQEELERRAAELERRERELDSAGLGRSATRQNNWPPLPSFCPVQPCFYQDIDVEISGTFQRTVKAVYYYWIVYSAVLLLNVLSCISQFCVDQSTGVDLGMAILWVLLFTPCSFLCWYRPAYKAFRSDSSFNFFLFFFVSFCQVSLCVLMAIGIPKWGFSGWIAALAVMKTSRGVGVLMLLTASLFTAEAVLGTLLLKKVHSLYRQTGASFQKAQQELSAGVLSNKAVQQAAAGAVQGAFTGGK